MTGLLDRLAELAKCDALPLQSRVLLTLLCHADSSGEAYPSVATMARRLGAEERSVTRVLSALASKGLIECESRARGGRGRGGQTRWRVAPAATDRGWLSFVENPDHIGQGLPPPTPTESVRDADPPTLTDSGSNPDQVGSQPRPKRSGEPNQEQQQEQHASRTPTESDRVGDGMDAASPRMSEKGAIGVLLQHGLRVCGNLFKFRVKLGRAIGEGLGETDLVALIERAKAEADTNAMGLIVHWLSTPSLWRDVLNESPSSVRYKPAPSTAHRGGAAGAKRIGDLLGGMGG